MSFSTISDDDIALKLMRLYRQAQQVHDPVLRQPIIEIIDGLIAALKHAPLEADWPIPGDPDSSTKARARPR